MSFVRSFYYHHAEGKQLVESQEAFDALAPGWCDSPAAAAAFAEAPADAKPPKGAAPVSASVSTPSGSAPVSLDGLTVKDAEPLIAAADAVTVALWIAAEKAAANPRKSLLAALDDRLAGLTAQ